MSVPARERGLLFVYRLRPLEPPALVVTLAGAIAAGLWMIPSAPPPPPEILAPADVTVPLMLVTIALSLGAGFVGGRDVDVAEKLLFSAPTPHRRAVLLRLALWAALAAAIVWVLGGRAEGVVDVAPGTLRDQALVQLFFAVGLVFALARLAGPLVGGGATLGLVVLLAGASSLWERFPLDVLAEAGSPDWRATAPRLLAAGAAALLVTFWTLRTRGRT